VELKKQGVVLDISSMDLESLDEQYCRISKKYPFLKDKMDRIEATFRIIYYPVWLCRLSLAKSIYTISIDGLKGSVLGAILPHRVKHRPLYAIIPAAFSAYIVSSIIRGVGGQSGGRSLLGDFMDSFAVFARFGYMFIFVFIAFFAVMLTLFAYLWNEFRYKGLVRFAKGLPPEVIKINKPPKTVLEKMSEKLLDATEHFFDNLANEGRY
jgi:hypothetical protein